MAVSHIQISSRAERSAILGVPQTKAERVARHARLGGTHVEQRDEIVSSGEVVIAEPQEPER
jgi:hypothetical protein